MHKSFIRAISAKFVYTAVRVLKCGFTLLLIDKITNSRNGLLHWASKGYESSEKFTSSIPLSDGPDRANRRSTWTHLLRSNIVQPNESGLLACSKIAIFSTKRYVRSAMSGICPASMFTSSTYCDFQTESKAGKG